MSGHSFLDVRFNDVMHVALARAASDIHLIPGARPAIRVDGGLEYVDGPVVTAEETDLLAERYLDERALARLRETGDTTATAKELDRHLLRVHVLQTEPGLAVAVRILPRTVPPLETLHLPSVVARFARKQRGLVIFAGPTGSGKSTSLAALVGRINSEQSRRIITIEDPIEYRHESLRSIVAQREVGRDVPSYASAVIGSLRADPDVIMIGEMRDTPTMRAALTAAETGHLVLTTLHTGDAVQTIDRIVDAFEGDEQTQVRTQVATALVAVVAQRLLPQLRSKGRRLAAEILIATDAVRATIREGRIHQLRNVMLTARDTGMQTLEHHLSELLAEGQIDRTSAAAATDRDGELREVAGVAI